MATSVANFEFLVRFSFEKDRSPMAIATIIMDRQMRRRISTLGNYRFQNCAIQYSASIHRLLINTLRVCRPVKTRSIRLHGSTELRVQQCDVKKDKQMSRPIIAADQQNNAGYMIMVKVSGPASSFVQSQTDRHDPLRLIYTL